MANRKRENSSPQISPEDHPAKSILPLHSGAIQRSRPLFSPLHPLSLSITTGPRPPTHPPLSPAASSLSPLLRRASSSPPRRLLRRPSSSLTCRSGRPPRLPAPPLPPPRLPAPPGPRRARHPPPRPHPLQNASSPSCDAAQLACSPTRAAPRHRRVRGAAPVPSLPPAPARASPPPPASNGAKPDCDMNGDAAAAARRPRRRTFFFIRTARLC